MDYVLIINISNDWQENNLVSNVIIEMKKGTSKKRNKVDIFDLPECFFV